MELNSGGAAAAFPPKEERRGVQWRSGGRLVFVPSWGLAGVTAHARPSHGAEGRAVAAPASCLAAPTSRGQRTCRAMRGPHLAHAAVVQRTGRRRRSAAAAFTRLPDQGDAAVGCDLAALVAHSKRGAQRVFPSALAARLPVAFAPLLRWDAPRCDRCEAERRLGWAGGRRGRAARARPHRARIATDRPRRRTRSSGRPARSPG